jgi:tetratricopeptide (TPR) repeat protein
VQLVKSDGELWSLLGEAHRMPFGNAQIVLVEQIIQHADAAEIDDLRFAARMLATTAYVHGGEPAKSFVTFSWCLAEFDAHPERYGREDASLLLWHFKYMVNGMTKFPEVPLARTYDVLDDMERRFRADGHSLHAVYQHRWLVAEHIGDAAAADEWFAKWSAAPRDENSDCVGCDPTSKVEHLVSRGRDEDAVALASPVLAGRLTCVEQPQAILTELMVPYLRTGRLTEAADAHRRAYRRMRGNVADLASIGAHVSFCALTGNEPRGLEIVERHLGWLNTAPSPFSAMRFAAAASLLLSRTPIDVTVRRGDDEVPARALAAELAEFARSTAARFDARNGTSYIGDDIAKTLDAEPYVDQLPLSAAERSATSSAPARKREPEPLPQEPGPLLDHAEQLLRLHRTDEARAALDAYDTKHPDGTDDPRRAEIGALLLMVDDRRTEAATAFGAAIVMYELRGDELGALIAKARAAALATMDDDDDDGDPADTGRVDDALAELESLTEQVIERGDAHQRASARLRLANVLSRDQRPAEALEHLDRVAADAPEDPLLLAEVDARRAHCLLLLERLDEALEATVASGRRYAELGDPPVAAVVYLVRGHTLGNQQSLGPAAEAFGEALRLAGDPEVTLAARVGRGRTYLAAGQPLDAVTDLVEAVADQVARGEEGVAATLRYDLAAAYHSAGQPLDAAEAAESALETLHRMEAQDSADRVRYLLSMIYRDLQEFDRAVELLEQLATNLDGFDNLPTRARMLEEAAQVLYEIDRDAQSSRRFGEAAEAYHAAGHQLDELRARRWQAVAARFAEDADAATSALGAADALAAAIAPMPADQEPAYVWEKAMLRLDGARVLAAMGRADEALDRVIGVPAMFHEIEAFGEALSGELLHGELLLRLDRPGEGEQMLRRVLAVAPHDSQLRENAAWLLGEALEMQGKQDEADAVRREHGLDGDE